MPYNGVGVFTSLGAPTFPAVPNTYILASYFNATMNDVFSGLSGAVTRDGQSPMTADLPMGGNKVTGAGDGVGPGDLVTFRQVYTNPTFNNLVMTGIPVAPTAAPGTDNTQLATTAFATALAFQTALPSQAGSAGKVLTTDGTNASWTGIKTINGAPLIGSTADLLLVQSITAAATQAVAGGRYALTNSTAQAAATNLALYSKQFDHATYAKGDTTVTANAVMGVDGTVSADKVIATAATGAHYILQYLGIATNVQYAMACRFKAAGITSVTMVIDDNTSSGVNVSVNLTTGVASPYNSGSGSGVVATTYYEGDGWWDVHLTGIPNPSGGATLRALIYVGIGSYTGDGTSGIYFDDLQLVTGSVVGSRVTTTSAAVARASGVVHPQRIILPASPATDTQVDVVSANTVDTNIIDPNGQQFYGTNGALSGPMRLDSKNAKVSLQFINGFWRAV